MDTGVDGTFEVPTIAGDFEAVVTDLEGCADQEVPFDAFTGAMRVTQSGDALTFAFPQAAFSGGIDASFSWVMADSVVVKDWGLDVHADGLAYSAQALWVLEGDMTIDVVAPDDVSCVLTASWSARERDE